MPELPEVQTTVNGLNKKIIGRRIVKVWFDAPKIIKKPKPEEFKKQIKGLKISGVRRRGKNILIYLKSAKEKAPSKLLLIHQKMTGHLLVGKWKAEKRQIKSLVKGPLSEKVNDYIHLILYLDNGQQTALSDLRKFAKVLLGAKEKIEKLPELAGLGPEPLDKKLSADDFMQLIFSQKRKIKQVLMDQQVIAGIGNIYSDEILWQAKIHPSKPANKLTNKELKSVFLAMKKILSKAVKMRGTSTSDFRDTDGKPGSYAKTLFVYQREGEPCQRCRRPIKRIKINNRSAHFCPKCQKI
jgi:formamidopyrimidine-DNA glycosylase